MIPSATLPLVLPEGEPASTYNPWRESLENCIEGSNYLRASEYRQLIDELDRLYAIVPASSIEAGHEVSDRIEMLKRFSDHNRVPLAMVSARQVYEIACDLEAAVALRSGAPTDAALNDAYAEGRKDEREAMEALIERERHSWQYASSADRHAVNMAFDSLKRRFTGEPQ